MFMTVIMLMIIMSLVKILNDFRGTGKDPDNNGETANNRDKQPSVAIPSEKLVICMHNNPKLSFRFIKK